jgi:hypothetical protein
MKQKTMTPSKILKGMSEDEIVAMRKKYFKKYPEDKSEFDQGVISGTIARRVDTIIKKYYKRQQQSTGSPIL